MRKSLAIDELTTTVYTYIVLFLTTMTIFIDVVTFTFWTFHRFFPSLSFYLFCLLISLSDNAKFAELMVILESIPLILLILARYGLLA
jgi:hypothetical protein